MKAVVIGTGRIGCGFAGQLLHASGYEVCFISRRAETAEQLQRLGTYRVRLVDGFKAEDYLVDHVRAIALADSKAVQRELANADLIVTSVGSTNLPAVAAQLANGLSQRSKPVNVLACENLNDAGPYLEQLVAWHLPAGSPADFGISGVLVGRVVSQKAGGPASKEMLVFTGDPTNSWIVDGSRLATPLPDIRGMVVTDRFNAWIQRKLYTYSAGHAITAYLGYLKGYHYIHTAICDAEIRSAVLAAMAEGQRGLLARYGKEIAGDTQDLREIIIRFENALLNDPITRVGRDPKRKLGFEDRLIGAARLAEQAGVSPEKLALGAAAALFFDNPDDPSALELQNWIKVNGAKAVLHELCGLNPNRGVGQFISDLWAKLAAGWQRSSQLLSLTSMAWS